MRGQVLLTGGIVDFGSGFQGCHGAMAGSAWWKEHLTPWSPGSRAGSSHHDRLEAEKRGYRKRPEQDSI